MRGTAFDLYHAQASYARVRVRGEAKKPARKEDMRRQKYGSANLKYVKVEHEGSGRSKKCDKKTERWFLKHREFSISEMM